ncbi:unnamed protein product [Adineta ricciae]|uniref:ASCH domain-containing protein n=1 Tax=Adineta ricciae TaxID=249248 RepID=A0A813VC97_ADIRI|nr:unnamed protein product [Adineta ricciae]
MIVKQLSEPWFSLIYCGKKTIEIRLDKGHFYELKPYDKIEFFNDELGFNVRRKFCVRVISIDQFDTFESALEKHLAHALPTIKSIEFGCQILKKSLSVDNAAGKYGILAIHMQRISALMNECRASTTSC